jgi:hypothetical protein
LKITGRFGSEAELVKTLLEQSSQLHVLEEENKKLEFLASVYEARLAKIKKETACLKNPPKRNHLP